MSRDVTSLWYRRHQGWKKQWNEKLPGHRFHQAKPILKLHFTSHDKRSCPDSSHSDSVPVEPVFGRNILSSVELIFLCCMLLRV